MTRNLSLFLLLSWAISPLTAAQIDPGAAVQQARDHLSARQYAEAAGALRGAVEAAQALPGEERTQALAAVHFYSAVALSGLRSEAEAKEHLIEFLTLQPAAELTNPEKYEDAFVALFRATKHRDEKSEFRFDNFYPGFSPFARFPADEESMNLANSAALIILGSRREKQEWNAADSGPQRASFIETFWKKRDPDAATPDNEFRETFNRRMTFADRAFASADARGSTTDRGKVFVLLGEPSAVRRRPLTTRDQVVLAERDVIINGTVEEWIYAREQLPMAITKKSVSYRFVTQRGIGDGVLQREEMYAFQAMMLAMNPNEHKK